MPERLQDCRSHYDLFPDFTRPAHRGSLPRWLWVEWNPPSSADGSGVALCGSDWKRRLGAASALERHPSSEGSIRPSPMRSRSAAANWRSMAWCSSASMATIRRTKRARRSIRATNSSSRSWKSYRSSGRSVPLFNDKHLSWNWDWAQRDVRHVAQDGLSVHGRIQPAGDLADSVRGYAARRAGSGGARASATAAWTATISMAWRPSSAWWSGATAARRA